MTTQPSLRFRAGSILLLVTVCALVYANATRNAFALDDIGVLLLNDLVHGLGKVRELLTSPYWPNTHESLGMYRPVTLLTFALEWAFWGERPVVFHATNILLHAVATSVAFLLALRLGIPAIAALVGALIFAVHPLHVEAVSNLVGRAEVLATIFVLLACHVYLSRHWPPLRRVMCMGGLFLIALGSKEIAVTLPLLILLIEAYRPADPYQPLLRRVLRERGIIIAFALAFSLYIAARWYALGTILGDDAAPFFKDLTRLQLFATFLRVVPEYVRLFLYPRDLVADYSPGVIFPVTAPDLRSIIGALILLGLAFATWTRRRSQPWAIFAFLWFLIAIFPVSNAVIPIGVILAERTLYLASVCIIFVAPAFTFLWAHKGVARVAGIGALSIVLCLLSLRTWTRTPVWHSTDTVLRDLIRHHPESFRSQWSVALGLRGMGRDEQALDFYERAIRLATPQYYGLAIEYGQFLLGLNRIQDAERLLRAALTKEYALPHVLLSQALVSQKRYSEALQVVEEGMKAHPDDPGFLHQLAHIYEGMGRTDDAISIRLQSIREVGAEVHPEQWEHLVSLYQAKGDTVQARVAQDSLAAVYSRLKKSERELLKAYQSGEFRPPTGSAADLLADVLQNK